MAILKLNSSAGGSVSLKVKSDLTTDEEYTINSLSTITSLPTSNLLAGNLAIVANELIATDLQLMFTKGFVGGSAYNTALVIPNQTFIPVGGWLDGMNYPYYDEKGAILAGVKDV